MSRRDQFVPTLRDLGDGPLKCKAFGHSWEPRPVSKLSPVGLEVWTYRLECGSCPKVRTDQVEPGTYDLYHRHYTDPPEYRLLEPASKADAVGEYIRRDRERQAAARREVKRLRKENGAHG